MEDINFVAPETAEDLLKGIDVTQNARNTISGILDLMFSSACLGVNTSRGYVAPIAWDDRQTGFFLQSAVQIILEHPIWSDTMNRFVDDNIFKTEKEAAQISAKILAEELSDICNERMSRDFTVEATVDVTPYNGEDIYNLSMSITLGQKTEE